MESPARKIEKLFQAKVMLYKDLLDTLTQEKETLLETNVDALWKISEQKQKIASKIESIRHSVLSVLNDMEIDHQLSVSEFNIPAVIEYITENFQKSDETVNNLRKMHVTLVTMKKQVQELAGDNKKFVEEYLDVLDELISIIANAGRPEGNYGRYTAQASKSNMLLHHQV